jgi:hypothetical protein
VLVLVRFYNKTFPVKLLINIKKKLFIIINNLIFFIIFHH